MLFIPASMAFMVQSSCIIFTALCSVLFLKRKLNGLHLKGIAASMVGIGIVTGAGMIYTHNSKSKTTSSALLDSLSVADATAGGAGLDDLDGLGWAELAARELRRRLPHIELSGAVELVTGVAITLVAQLAQALQFISEERLLQKSVLHPLQVLGLEGLLASLLSFFLLVIAAFVPGFGPEGVWESWTDTAAQLRSSDALAAICLVNVVGVAGTNMFGLRVSGATWRQLCVACACCSAWQLVPQAAEHARALLRMHWPTLLCIRSLYGTRVS
jgi:drug/metabolite transporter (DMT)-like permease